MVLNLHDSIATVLTQLEELDTDLNHDLAHQADQLRSLQERMSLRMGIAPNTLTVGIAGTTGSGKSSLFNALTGRNMSIVSARRPTTSEPLAAIFPQAQGSAQQLLDWLNVEESILLDNPPFDLGPSVIIDLPDIDSIKDSNRIQAERLIAGVDVLVWVVDPEKYADQRLHETYLKPLSAHAPVMEVVLNQIDRLEAENLDPVLSDLRRLLTAQTIDLRPLAVSAQTGQGVSTLGGRLGARAEQKTAQVQRLTYDAQTMARSFLEHHPFEQDQARTLEHQLNITARGVVEGSNLKQFVKSARQRRRYELKKQVAHPVARLWLRSRPTPTFSSISSGAYGESLTDLRNAAQGKGMWWQAIRFTIDTQVPELDACLHQRRSSPPVRAMPKWASFFNVMQWFGLMVFAGTLIVFIGETALRYFGITVPPAVYGVLSSPGYPPLPSLSWSVVVFICAIAASLAIAMLTTITTKVSLRRYEVAIFKEESSVIVQTTHQVLGKPILRLIEAARASTRELIKITQ